MKPVDELFDIHKNELAYCHLAFNPLVDTHDPINCFPCIYFLIKDEEIVYVGKTVDLMMRISSHLKTKDFDSFNYMVCDKCDLNKLETYYVLKYSPVYNKIIPNTSKFISQQLAKIKFKVYAKKFKELTCGKKGYQVNGVLFYEITDAMREEGIE